MSTEQQDVSSTNKATGSDPRRLMKWLAVDVVGLVLFAAGLVWFVSGTRLFGSLPQDNTSAAAMAAVGGIAMLWAAISILREVAGRSRITGSHTPGK